MSTSKIVTMRALLVELGFKKKDGEFDYEIWIKPFIVNRDLSFTVTLWNTDIEEDLEIEAEITTKQQTQSSISIARVVFPEVIPAASWPEIDIAWFKKTIVCPLCNNAFKFLEDRAQEVASIAMTGDI